VANSRARGATGVTKQSGSDKPKRYIDSGDNTSSNQTVDKEEDKKGDRSKRVCVTSMTLRHENFIRVTGACTVPFLGPLQTRI
jgi:hypothetical protein